MTPHVCASVAVLDSGKKADEIAQAAVKSYLHRVAPKVMLKAPSRIMGSLESVAKYLHESVNFIHNMAAENYNTCPFQYDSGM